MNGFQLSEHLYYHPNAVVKVGCLLADFLGRGTQRASPMFSEAQSPALSFCSRAKSPAKVIEETVVVVECPVEAYRNPIASSCRFPEATC